MQEQVATNRLRHFRCRLLILSRAVQSVASPHRKRFIVVRDLLGQSARDCGRLCSYLDLSASTVENFQSLPPIHPSSPILLMPFTTIVDDDLASHFQISALTHTAALASSDRITAPFITILLDPYGTTSSSLSVITRERKTTAFSPIIKAFKAIETVRSSAARTHKKTYPV